MKSKKIPMRTCVVTKEKVDKRDLIRVVKDNEGHIFVDPTGKKNGKGAYLKLSKEVIDQAKKTKALDHALEISIPDAIYEELYSLVGEK